MALPIPGKNCAFPANAWRPPQAVHSLHWRLYRYPLGSSPASFLRPQEGQSWHMLWPFYFVGDAVPCRQCAVHLAERTSLVAARWDQALRPHAILASFAMRQATPFFLRHSSPYEVSDLAVLRWPFSWKIPRTEERIVGPLSMARRLHAWSSWQVLCAAAHYRCSASSCS